MDEMSKVWKKKEFLRDCTDIPVKMGKGRLSGEAHAELVAACARGVRFSDYTPVKTETVVVKKSGTDTPRVRVVREDKPATPAETAWLAPEDYRYPENLYVAVEENGTKHNMRAACNGCGLSLTNHVCNTPSVYGNPVRIVGVK